MAQKCPLCGKNLEEGSTLCAFCKKPGENTEPGSRLYLFTQEMLSVYGREQLAALEKIFQAGKQIRPNSSDAASHRKILENVVQKIICKIKFQGSVPPENSLTFLQEFYDALKNKIETRPEISKTDDKTFAERTPEIKEPRPEKNREEAVVSESGEKSALSEPGKISTSEKETAFSKPAPSAQEIKPASPEIPRQQESKIIPFLRDHIVFLLLALGVGFIFTSAVIFFRSHWEEYKIPVFYTFFLITLACFGIGYFLLIRKKENIIALTFLLLASLFFPLNFYFALKAGLIADHGNRYILLWITSCLFIFHSFLLRSTLFTVTSLFIITWAHLTTLNKFLPDQHYEYGIFFALQALAFGAFSVWLNKIEAQVKSYFVLGYGVIFFLYAVLHGLFFWQISIFIWIMFLGILLGFIQVRYFEKTYFGSFGSCQFALAIVFFSVLSLHHLGIPTLWPGISSLLLAFCFVWAGEYWKSNSNKEILFKTGIVLPILTFAAFAVLGSYEYLHTRHPLLWSAVIAYALYVFWGYRYRNPLYISLSIVFSFLVIYSVFSFISDISPLYFPFILLLWGIVLGGVGLSKYGKERPWLQNPLLWGSEICLLIVLLAFLVFGQNYYYQEFGVLSLGLILVSVYYALIGFYFQRMGMVLSSLCLVVVLIALFSYRLSLRWYHFSLLMLCVSFGLLGMKYLLEKRKIGGEKAFSILSSTLAITFSVLPFCSGLGDSMWEVKLAVSLAFAFFSLRAILEKAPLDIWLSLVSCTTFYYLLFAEARESYYLPAIFLPLAVVAIIASYVHKKADWLVSKSDRSTTEVFSNIFVQYSQAILFLSVVALIGFFRLYYYDFRTTGLATTLFLTVGFILLCYKSKRHWAQSIYLWIALLCLYAHYLLWLPKDFYPFTYGLFFIPVACILVYWSMVNKGTNFEKPLFIMAQITANFFLLLPLLFPGIVPSASVSFFVMLWIFAFYFLCLYLYQKSVYIYISTTFFLMTVLVGLFAVKIFRGQNAEFLQGQEITFVMSLFNLVPLLIGYILIKKNKNTFAIPLFQIFMAHILVLLGSLLVQGKVDYPTLYCIVCVSLQIGLTAYIRVEDHFSEEDFGKSMFLQKFLSYLSILLFAAGYYLLLSKADLDYPAKPLQYMSLSIVSLIFALLFSRMDCFQKPFFAVALLSPILSLMHVSDTGMLSVIFAVTFLVYLFSAVYFGNAVLSCCSGIYLILTGYSLLSYMESASHVLCIYAIVGGIVLISLSYLLTRLFPSKESLLSPLREVAFLNQFMIVFFAVVDYQYLLDQYIYLTAGLCLLNAVFLMIIYSIHRNFFCSAIFFFFLSYYFIAYSWAVTVWEFYTIPPGLLILGIGAYLQKKEEEQKIHQELYILGLLLILLPTLIQSYRGWYSHLYFEGNVYQNLYHSIFLSVESLVLLLWGLYRKRIVFFMTGIVFLVSDVLLMLFSYIHFGSIPHAIWWGILGLSLIVAAWILEYQKRKLLELKSIVIEKHKSILEELKTWK